MSYAAFSHPEAGDRLEIEHDPQDADRRKEFGDKIKKASFELKSVDRKVAVSLFTKLRQSIAS